MYNDLFSIIIFHKHSSDKRLYNLTSLLEYLKTINKFDIIIVEQDSQPYDKIVIENFNVKYVFDKYLESHYNKSRAYNIGITYSDKPFFCFHDADIIIQKHIYGFCSKMFNDYDVVGPYNKLMELTGEETNDFYYANKYFLPRNPNEVNTLRDANLAGGIMFINRDSFYKIGKWDEQFVGWGGEDDAMSCKVRQCLTYRKFTSIALHLYHEKIIKDEFYNENYKKLTKIELMTKDEILNRVKQNDKKS